MRLSTASMAPRNFGRGGRGHPVEVREGLGEPVLAHVAPAPVGDRVAPAIVLVADYG